MCAAEKKSACALTYAVSHATFTRGNAAADNTSPAGMHYTRWQTHEKHEKHEHRLYNTNERLCRLGDHAGPLRQEVAPYIRLLAPAGARDALRELRVC
jgi:hypothetical protein